MAVMEVLQQQRDRDLLQLDELEGANRAADGPEVTATRAALQAVDAKVWAHLNAASLVRLRFTLLSIAENVVSVAGLTHKPRTILLWVREFRKLDGYLKLDGRGLHERE